MSSPRSSTKRLWSVADVAKLLGISHRRAKRLLKRIDAKHGGRLLIPSQGTNRGFTFYVATLMRFEPDLVTRGEDDGRLDELAEQLAELRADQRRIAQQVGVNTRGIEAVKAKTKRAA